MKWRVKLMREAGRRIPWKILVNEPGQVGTIRTQVLNYGRQGPFTVAVLVGDSVLESGIVLIEPQLFRMGDQALILRGYERIDGADGPFTVLQEWRCEPA